MAVEQSVTYPRRIYPLSPRELTEEQIAVVFAMTSRRPEPFDEIAQTVSQEKAADFHERWVLGYGHASVAEHGIIHMAVENISRLACDTLEDNRLASYTEKSTRYQVLPEGYYHVPKELRGQPEMAELYTSACETLFQSYRQMVDGVREYLHTVQPQGPEEKDSAYNLRLRRQAVDSCRFILPAATLTNVGVTMNARSMEHAIRKLLSSELLEEQELGEQLKVQGRAITPTLIKYAERNDYLVVARQRQRALAPPAEPSPRGSHVEAHLVRYDPEAEARLVTALLYRFATVPYQQLWEQVQGMGTEEREGVITQCLERMGPHDAPVREAELVDYTFDLVMDYGAYREFKRHRMQSYIPQPLTVEHGYLVPELVVQAKLEQEFSQGIEVAERAFHRLYAFNPHLAPYLVTHAHRRRVLAKLNLRECYHLFKLRTAPQAHFSIRAVADEAFRLARETHPLLFRFIQLRTG